MVVAADLVIDTSRLGAEDVVSDRQATAEDNLPEEITFHGTDVKTESACRPAVNDGISYFAAKNDDSHAACVVIVPDTNPSLWVAGCGSLASGGEVVTINSATGTSAVLVVDGRDTKRWESEGWTKVHNNVLISRQ